MSTQSLPRDEQITLIALFPQGNNYVDFHTASRITARQKAAFDSLVEQGFITVTPLGKNGLQYKAIPEKCGRPLFQLKAPTEAEAFAIVEAL